MQQTEEKHSLRVLVADDEPLARRHLIQSLEKIRNSELSKLAILKELSNILPSSVWLTDCRYHKQELRLSGYAASASDLISILDGSPLFTASEFTAPITRTREGQESFKIETSIEEG
jgi:general secretion pathway protein L